MDNSSSNEDEEPKICTVFSSSSSTVFDSIAFSPQKAEGEGGEGEPGPAPSFFSPASQANSNPPPSEELAPSSPDIGGTVQYETQPEPPPSSHYVPVVAEMEGLYIQDESEKVFQNGLPDAGQPQLSLESQGQGDIPFGSTSSIALEPNEGSESPIPPPPANMLFTNAPDVPFPVGEAGNPEAFNNSEPASMMPFSGDVLLQPYVSESPAALPGMFPSDVPVVLASNPVQEVDVGSQQIIVPSGPNLETVPVPFQPRVPSPTTASTFNNASYTELDAWMDAWIPKPETKRILEMIGKGVQSGTYFPDKSHMTTPGIIYEDDLIDKVGVNMSRIFGEAEASKRKILTADSVSQDDNGLRELIKLGCYRSAINLTKRLLTLYGQGPGRVGQFSKHNPHTLQLWFTRISLLMRIREFAIAESEIDAFKEFDNPDLYYEYYPDAYGRGRKGSMVPFNFRVLAAEIPQYSKKHNESLDRLTTILRKVEKIIQNLHNGFSDDGTQILGDAEKKGLSLEIWCNREIRVLYSLANASLLAKDYHNAFKYLSILCEKDKSKEPQLKSALGRFFLQLGDLTTANSYFQAAADLRQGDSDAEQAENLIDSAMITISQGAYPEAFALLKQALPIQPDNFMITNNMAVCLLYMGKVKESLALMETAVKNNTPQLLQENVLLNLSTIYELENTDGHKKNSLLKLISEYKGDGINLAALKMPNLI